MKKFTDIHKKLDELGINFLNIDFDNPPEEITYKMLEREMNKNSLDFVADRIVLWRAWSRLMMNPHPFGMYSEEDLIDKTKRKQFLKYCEQIKSKYINNNNKKSLKRIEYANTIYRDEPYKVAIPAAGGSFLKRTRYTQKQNKRKKNRKPKRTRKTYYGGRHDDYVPDNQEDFMIRPIPLENYNYENNNPHGVFQRLIPSTMLPLLYAMQIPNQFDILSMKQMFMYLMYTRNIDYLIDLHACHVPNSNPPHQQFPTRGCNPDDLEIEMNTWQDVKDIYPDTRNNPNIGSSHIPYLDMSSGNHDVWREIAALPDVTTRSSVVHCLAGYGRTASVLVFLTIRDHANTRDYVRTNINANYWGLQGVAEFRQYILDLIPHQHGQTEFWDVTTSQSMHRLCVRLNFIICHLAILWNITPVVAYGGNLTNPISVERDALYIAL
jgi:protein tyrosine phosphatase